MVTGGRSQIAGNCHAISVSRPPSVFSAKVSDPTCTEPDMSCDTHEIEIEQRAYGALAPELYAVLDEHLAGCASCRAFAGGPPPPLTRA